MKKIILIIMLFLFFALPVSAENMDNSLTIEVETFFEKYNIDFDDIKNNPIDAILQAIKRLIKNNVHQPLNYFGKIAAVLLFSSLINFFASDQTEKIVKFINMISIIAVFANIYEQMNALIDSVSIAFFEIKNFMTAFLPVFAGITFVSGEMITSTVYTGFFLIAVVTIANLCINYIIPSLNIFLAIGATNTVSDIVNLKPFCDFYAKAVKVTMTTAVSVLCFVLSIQSTITQGQDTLAVKTGKMLVTSAVPIIGSTLQGAVSSVYASMGVLKGFCGLAGVIVIINILMPHIIKLAVYWVGYFVLMIISTILENESASNLFSVFQQIIEVMLSVSVLFMVLLMFSLSIMIKLFQGV